MENLRQENVSKYQLNTNRHRLFPHGVHCLILLLVVVWGGCGGDVSEDGATTLRIVWMGPELETYGIWKNGFEAEHPGVEIEQQFVSYDQGPTFYTTMIQGDNLPDLGFLLMG